MNKRFIKFTKIALKNKELSFSAFRRGEAKSCTCKSSSNET